MQTLIFLYDFFQYSLKLGYMDTQGSYGTYGFVYYVFYYATGLFTEVFLVYIFCLETVELT